MPLDETADSVPALSIFEMRRKGWLVEGAGFSFYLPVRAYNLVGRMVEQLEGHVITGCTFGGCVQLTFPYELGELMVMLPSTDCNFGSEGEGTEPCRLWFECPDTGCGRRCAKLYLAYDERGRLTMSCRLCLGLTYGSQRERSGRRAYRRASKVRERCATVGWRISHPATTAPPRAKGMHQKTYARLLEQWERDMEAWLDSVALQTSRLQTRVARICREPRQTFPPSWDK